MFLYREFIISQYTYPNIFKFCLDKTLPKVKAVLKQKDDGKKGEYGGIGTTATRASIIERLKEHGYLDEKGGKIRSTEKARAFYRLLPPEIRGADVTASWWLIQQDIADGKADVNALQKSVVEVFKNHFDTAYVGASIPGGRPTVGKCPLCGKDVWQFTSKNTGKPFYICSSTKSEQQEDGTWKTVSGCGFKLFSYCGKTFTLKQAQALLAGKRVSLKGCTSKKTGKTFDCNVALKEDGSLYAIFDTNKLKGKPRLWRG